MTGRAEGGLVMFTRLKTHRRIAAGEAAHLVPAAQGGEDEDKEEAEDDLLLFNIGGRM